MSAPNTTKWIGTGLLGLPLYGVLTFWPSLDPQPDPNTDYEAWARYVSTNYYVLKHLLGSGLGLILASFGTVALGAYLAKGSAGRLGLVAMVITVLGYALFLMPMGGLYLRCTRGGAGVPGGHRGVFPAATHLREIRTDGDLPASHPTPVRGQRAPRSSGLALGDAA